MEGSGLEGFDWAVKTCLQVLGLDLQLGREGETRGQGGKRQVRNAFETPGKEASLAF